MSDDAETLTGWILEDEDDIEFFFENLDDPEAIDEELDHFPPEDDADDRTNEA